MDLETIQFEINQILCIWCKRPVQKDLGLDYHITCELDVLSYVPGYETLQIAEVEPKIGFHFEMTIIQQTTNIDLAQLRVDRYFSLHPQERPSNIVWREVGQVDANSRFQTTEDIEKLFNFEEKDFDHLLINGKTSSGMGRSQYLAQIMLAFQNKESEFTIGLEHSDKIFINKNFNANHHQPIKIKQHLPTYMIKNQKKKAKLQRRY